MAINPLSWPVGTLVWTPTKRVAKVIGYRQEDGRVHLEYLGCADKRDALVTLSPNLCQRVDV